MTLIIFEHLVAIFVVIVRRLWCVAYIHLETSPCRFCADFVRNLNFGWSILFLVFIVWCRIINGGGDRL